MLTIATLFNRRILYLFGGYKKTNKESRKSFFDSENMHLMVKEHPCIFYLFTFLGLPLGIMFIVFFTVYIAVTPLSYIMGWM